MKYKDKVSFDKANMFKDGVYNSMFEKYFTKKSYINMFVNPQTAPVFTYNVTFEPGCRNDWHIHHAKSGGGQILLCTAGEGWYQEDGEKPVSLSEGSFVFIPTEVKHWHGAKKDSWFSHVAIEVPGEDKTNEWLERVSDDEYNALSLKEEDNTRYSDVYRLKSTKKEIKSVNMFGMGIYNFPLKKYFSGKSYLKIIATPKKASMFISNVTFEPGCRNNWHVHTATNGGGQLLYCTGGEGWYQAEGEEPISLSEGSFVYIPANVNHWHGAKKDSWFTHVAVGLSGENSGVQWNDPVSDLEYKAL